jgi:hypothetical protein
MFRYLIPICLMFCIPVFAQKAEENKSQNITVGLDTSKIDMSKQFGNMIDVVKEKFGKDFEFIYVATYKRIAVEGWLQVVISLTIGCFLSFIVVYFYKRLVNGKIDKYDLSITEFGIGTLVICIIGCAVVMGFGIIKLNSLDYSTLQRMLSIAQGR